MLQKICYILLYRFGQGDNASLAFEKNCSVYGEGALYKSVACNCFASFLSGNFDVKDHIIQIFAFFDQAFKNSIKLPNKLSNIDTFHLMMSLRN